MSCIWEVRLPLRCSLRWYVELTIEQEVSYGLDYAFEFGLTNPFRTPATADNAWHRAAWTSCMQQLRAVQFHTEHEQCSDKLRGVALRNPPE